MFKSPIIVYEYGEDIRRYSENDRVLVIVNHQSTADVPTLFTVLQTKGVATRKVSFWFWSLLNYFPYISDHLADGCHVPLDALRNYRANAWRLLHTAGQSNSGQGIDSLEETSSEGELELVYTKNKN